MINQCEIHINQGMCPEKFPISFNDYRLKNTTFKQKPPTGFT